MPTPPIVRRLFVGLVALGFLDAVRRAWLCDDAFISFRYADHLVAGQGLVFNVGEHVQGYTNPLLTLMLGGLHGLGLPLEGSAMVLGLLFFSILIALLARHASSSGALPFAALGLVAMPSARDFATSGLETSLFMLLVTAVVLCARGVRSRRDALLLGTLGSLAALTRPDGLLVYGLAGLFAVARAPRGRRLERFALAAAPALLLLLPWLVFAARYYGDVLPNTFYAKSAARPFPLQGLRYEGVFLLAYAPLVAGLFGLAARWREDALAPTFVLAWLAYVAWVGGDFMFARFCLPAAPLLLIGLERLLWRVARPRTRALSQLTLAALLLAAPIDWALAQDPLEADERAFYQSPRCDLASARREGEVLRPYFQDTEARVAIGGSQARLAFYAHFPYAIEAITGLTDREIAHRRIARRGRVGHEKHVDRAYLMGRGVHFVFDYCQHAPGRLPYDGVDFGHGVRGRVYTYAPELMDEMRARGARIPRFEDYLDRYLEDLDRRSDDELRHDYDEFRAFYFAHARDSAREGRLRAELARRGLLD